VSILLCTDIHLSDRPRDRYRFGLFEFLVDNILISNLVDKVDLVIILGDITDEKDNHSAWLVNNIVSGINRLAELVPVIILKGNHDYKADPANPFFDFLNQMKNIRFVTTPRTYTTKAGSNLFLIPHINDEAEWDNLPSFRGEKIDYAFFHQTVTGAISESGRRLDGYSLKPLKRLKAKAIFGGDVHKPHTIGPVTYIGPPYHVRFGDNFEPRCLLLNEKKGTYKELNFECPRKWSLTIREPDALLEDKRLRKGDQCKVDLELTREELPEWPVFKGRIVQLLAELGLENYGVTLSVNQIGKRDKEKRNEEVVRNKLPAEVLGSFMKKERLPRTVREVGLQLLRD
jgi:DNA repair exonuclease SbcCD nuclease subunit